MIKKFKNGKIKLSFPKSEIDKYWLLDDEGNLKEDYYYDVMNMEDLYFNQINGYMYIVDFNTGLVYELDSQNIQNPLKWLLDYIGEYKKYYLYPLSRKESQYLMNCLEQGY